MISVSMVIKGLYYIYYRYGDCVCNIVLFYRFARCFVTRLFPSTHKVIIFISVQTTDRNANEMTSFLIILKHPICCITDINCIMQMSNHAKV